MPLLNAFVDSVICVGFNSERGVTIDPESKNNESFFTSYLQSSILAIITDDRATYPLSTVNESIDPFYPPIRRLSSHSNSGLSTSSGRSSPPISLLGTGTRTQKQHLILTAYKDLPFFCFPDGVRATYQPEKEKIHHFVLTQDGKRSYALALTFQQQFTFKTDKPDDDGIYQINDVKSSTLNTGRSSVSKISVAINKSEIVSPPSTSSSSSSTGKKNSKKIPSSFPTPDTNSAKQVQSPSSQDTAKQQSSNHYGISTINSYKKNLPSAAPPLGRARSQGDISSSNTISTISSSTGMRKRSGSIIFKAAPTSPESSSTSLDITKPFYLPHCIVLISTEPYWTALQETISIIHDEITRSKIVPSSQAYKKLIQKYAFLACNTPIPPVPWEPFSLSFNVTTDQFVITFDPPINANRPILDLDLSILLLTLNIGRLLDVLAVIFTEQPIIFFSSNYSTLVTTLECLLYIIYPLKWTNVYIPLVPDGLRDIYLEGPPGLYIKGAHSRHQSIVEELNISCTCNLDNDKNIHIPKHVELHSIPPTKMHSFINPITQLLEEIKVARSLKAVSTAPRLSMEQQRELKRQQRLETNEKITEIFLAFMIDLCSDAFEPIYWKVNPQQINPTGASLKTSTNDRKNANLSQTTATIPTFSKEKYLLPKTEGIELEFYRALVESTAFLNLLKEEMSSTSPSGFRQICQIYSLSTEDQLYHFSNTLSEDTDNNHIESTTTLYDSLFSQMVLPLPDWSTDLPKHYLDSCIELFTNELKNAQRERSPAVISVYAYLRGCARLARGDFIEGLRDLYLIENANLFPQKYIETNIVPRLAEEYLLDLFITESFYAECLEWKKVSLRPKSQSLTVIDLDETKNVVDASPIESSPDVSEEWNIEENTLTYQQFSEHVHRLSIVLDKETTETLFKALLYWTDNSISKTLKTDRTSTNNTNKPSEPMKPSGKPSSPATIATLQDTLAMINNPRRKGLTATASLKSSTQSNLSLPTTLFELFLDIWQQTNAEKVRMNHHLPEDRQKQESILKVSSSGIVSKKDGPGQIILTQKRLYFLPEVRSSAHLLTELIDMISVEKYQHQTAFFSSKPGIKIYTSLTSLLPRDNNNIKLKTKTSSLEKGSKLSSISLFFKTNQEQELWYTIIVELWSGLTIAHEQCDTAVLNKASRLIALMDTLANIDYQEEILTGTDRQLTNSHLKSKQHHNEVCLEMALKDLSIFTRMRQTGTLKPLSVETRNVLTRRLTPSINETEHYGVRCLLFTEHPDTGRSSIWCAYGSKLKVFNVTTWICDPNDLCFPSLIASMCLDARFKLWVRCIKGQLFVVDTLTRRCDAELVTIDGENACETIEFDRIHNHILTANRNGTITLWNASDWERLYEINLLEIYNKTHNIQERKFVSRAVLTLRSPTNSSNVEKPSNRKQASFGVSNEPINPIDIPSLPSPIAPAQIIPSSTDKLERIQIYEDLLFACYHDDYIIILRRSNSDIYTYEHLIPVKYKTDNSLLIDSFLAYNKQLWVSTGCIISIFNVNNTNDENEYNLLTKKPIDDENVYNLIMKKSVDDDNLVTMLGFSGYIWAGSLHGKVYVFRMDNYELYKTFAGHRDSVLCLCSMSNTYVVSGSAQNDTSIAIWEHVQTSDVRSTASTTTPTTTGGSIFNLHGCPNTPSPKKNDTKGEFFK